MRFPAINKQPLRSVTVPKLSGGTNLRDAVTMVEDNQLTDSKNMWFKGNILKTRPGLKTNCLLEFDGFNPGLGGREEEQIKAENATYVKDGRLYRLVSRHTAFRYSNDGNDLNDQISHIQFFWVSDTEDEKIELPAITGPEKICFTNYFVAQHKKDIFCFCKTRDNEGIIYKLGTDTWAKVEEKDIHKPLIYSHCVVTSKSDGGFKGTQIEGLNMLGNVYRMIYSTVNKSLLDNSDENSTHFMTYTVPFSGEKNAIDNVERVLKVKITQPDGYVVTHTVKREGAEWVEDGYKSDNLQLTLGQIGGGNLLINFMSKDGGIATVKASDYIEDNMEIIAPYYLEPEIPNKVFSMTQSEWFGGDALGISGGTRLFLCGNTNDEEKSLVLWSGLDNPLYFPENCCAYVGNSNQAVTGFGRQNDTLVIFKERETYYTQYMRNSDITAQDLIDQSVVDYAASSVYFPMIQLHPNIGCDLPDTVQLCRNRLVWACSDGNVYTLMSEDQYSERNIYCISDMIKRKLKNETGKAYSADWNGHYMLFYGSHIYVMNYESYGYVYASSYNKTSDAQLMIPWWYWELPESSVPQTVFVCAGAPLLVFSSSAAGTLTVSVFDERTFTDNTGEKKEIPSMFVTKIFDFGAPHYFKNVTLINAAFGNNGARPISTFFVTEQGEEESETLMLTESGEDEYSPDFVHNRQLRPSLGPINRIGFKAECTGYMSLDSISLYYRLLGGAR